MKELEAKMKGFVLSGRMSQDEADSVMLSRLHGHYRTRYMKEMAERRAEDEAQAHRTAANALQSQQDTTASLQARSQSLTKALNDYSKYAKDQTAHIAQFFFPEVELSANAPRSPLLTRHGFTWPSEPSPLAFFLILAACTPIGTWPPDGSPAPDINASSAAVLLFLHEDKLQQSQVQIQNAFSGSDPSRITATFIQSKKLLTEYMKDDRLSNQEKQEYMNRNWESAKHYVLRAMRPESSYPPVIIAFMVDQAAQKLAASRS
jgi:hypothetical protein